MHQPVYIPYYPARVLIDNNGAPGGPYFSFSLYDVWAERGGPYRGWPTDAIEYGLFLPHLGAQISLSGSLIESLNNLDETGWNSGLYVGWWQRFKTGMNYKTSLGNSRLQPVYFPFHHPIAGLVFNNDLKLHLLIYKKIFEETFPGETLKGFFPAETAFKERIIPVLKEVGIEWAIVDNIHLSRTLLDYPWTGGSGVVEPNRADMLNGYLNEHPNSGWIQLNGLWAPEAVAGGFAYRPHFAQYVDPQTEEISKIVIVPASSYMGNEDGRGGFGALNYEGVMSQLIPFNDDPSHPQLILLHHDGDNYGGGTDAYYHHNFENFVNWISGNPDFEATTIEDYLEQFSPDSDDVVHVEPGGWIGGGCLDPEFHKWLGDPQNGYSSDWISWAVITAAHNWVWTANSILPYSSVSDILHKTGNATSRAFHYYLVSETSCYFYWENTQDAYIWEGNPARACNMAIDEIEDLVRNNPDTVGPTIFEPQREPYNPGESEWGEIMPCEFTVWTFIYDVNGVQSAYLLYRTSDSIGYSNMLYEGVWDTLQMNREELNPATTPSPHYIARRYFATVQGIRNKFVDYFVVAIDSLGNESKSPINHVWVGSGEETQPVYWEPENPDVWDTVTIYINSTLFGWLHWGVNGWTLPREDYWPPGTYVWPDSHAVETPFSGSAPSYYVKLGPFVDGDVHTVDLVLHFEDGSWNNNNGEDFHIAISIGGYTMDGELDPYAVRVAQNGEHALYVSYNSPFLYVATESSTSEDVFIFVSLEPESLVNAPWAKSGMVANYSYFLACESTNGWSSFFNAEEQIVSFPHSNGNYLEGVLNLSIFDSLNLNTLYLAVGGYESWDGGTLLWQIPEPSGLDSLSIEPSEFYPFLVATGKDENSTIKPMIANPFYRTLRVELPGKFKLSLYDISGRRVLKVRGYKIVTVETAGLPSGVYILSIEGENCLKVEKLIHIH